MLEKRLQAPASEPVTLAEAKNHLRVEHTLDDALITRLITAARQHVENITGLAIGQQQWRAFFDDFYRLELARHPVIAIDAVRYIDPDGNAQVVPAADYQATETLPVEVVSAPGAQWPDVIDGADAVTVDYTCGTAADLPVVQAVLLLLADMYENREASIIGVSHTPNPAVDALLAPYRQAPL